MQEMVMAGAVKLREVVWNGYGKQSSTPRSSMVLSSYSSKALWQYVLYLSTSVLF
jgi:hypothetical protein